MKKMPDKNNNNLINAIQSLKKIKKELKKENLELKEEIRKLKQRGAENDW